MYPTKVPCVSLFIFFSCVYYAAGETPPANHELRMSIDDVFTVVEKADWKFDVEALLPLRFANVKIEPRTGDGFSMMLYFKCDTPDLARFNSPAKIEKAVKTSSAKYLSHAVEKEVKLKRFDASGWYGCYTVLTDSQWAKAKTVPKGEFKYITRGMTRLSPDSALAFSIMSNDLDSKQYKELIAYVRGFAKEGFAETK